MYRPLYLVDASLYIFRAWFAVPEQVRDEAGACANAVHGFGSFLCDLIEYEGPTHVVCAFDESLTTSFRHELYPDYKANRPPPPPELERQFGVCRSLAEALGVATLASPRYEADDLVGSAARHWREAGHHMVYVTADKDYAQLLETGDWWWDAARDRWLDPAGVEASLGVRPDQVADLLALAGDAVDNIPGVPGIGAKTAAALLRHGDSLDGLYADLGGVGRWGIRGAARVRRLLEAHREAAFLSRELTRIRRDLPIRHAHEVAGWRGVDADALERLALPVQLRNRIRRLPLADAATEVSLP
ncbi:5'-3' exonuclease [Arhodomonas sp. SL1]|uniref:5'-3' exonuclease n=1 Tax=Arhodomonas sp. SL1 TaxID=3425691 RepID=UPI003F88552A